MFESLLEHEPVEPDWSDHPVYSSMVSDSERVRDWLQVAPVARSMADLAELDAGGLSPAERVDLLALLAEQVNWLESVKARVLAVIDEGDSTEQRLSQEAVSLALMVPTRTAQHQLKAASTLAKRLPGTLNLLQGGRISARHADAMAEASWRLADDVLPALESKVLGRAAEQTVSQFKQSLRRALIALDPSTAAQREQRALADRRVGYQPVEDGMAELVVLLPAPPAQSIFTRLTAAARLLPADDPRSLDQKRADLLVDAVLSGLPLDALPGRPSHRPSIQVVVSADTLLGLDDQPAELVGYGPITAQTARRLAADDSGTWRRLLTDPDTGALLDISQHRYRASPRLKDYVAARDGVCAFPTCNQPGYRCDYDHIQPYAEGGETCRSNAALACRRHNNCKNGTGWQYLRNPDGTCTWTTDTGHRYRNLSPERWPGASDRISSDRAGPKPKPEPKPEPEPPRRSSRNQLSRICRRLSRLSN